MMKQILPTTCTIALTYEESGVLMYEQDSKEYYINIVGLIVTSILTASKTHCTEKYRVCNRRFKYIVLLISHRSE